MQPEREWGRLAVARYPNRRTFLKLLSDPAYASMEPYKFIALEIDLMPVSGDMMIPDLRWLGRHFPAGRLGARGPARQLKEPVERELSLVLATLVFVIRGWCTPASGNDLDPILRKYRIGGDHRQVVHLGCGNNHPVARIGVHSRQFRRADADLEIQR